MARRCRWRLVCTASNSGRRGRSRVEARTWGGELSCTVSGEEMDVWGRGAKGFLWLGMCIEAIWDAFWIYGEVREEELCCS
jgi:hypothetical protein